MMVDGQRRFRKRGGAKKKKKVAAAATADRPPTENRNRSEDRTTPSATAATNYFSGFQTETRLDPDLQSYLEKLQSDLQQLDRNAEAALAYTPNDDDPPPSVLLSRNSLKELSPSLHQLIRDNAAARLIEMLLRTAHDPEVLGEALQAVLAVGPSRFADLAAHRSASHSLEALLRAVRQNGSPLGDLPCVVSAWSAEEVATVISSAPGSHVFRAVVAALAGLPNEEPREAKLDDSRPAKIMTYLDNHEDVADEHLEALRRLGSTLLESNVNVPDLLWQPSSCAAIQGLLSAVTVADKSLAKRLGTEGLKAGFTDLVYDTSGCRFVERAILCIGASCVADNMKGHMAELARHPRANFAVQRYLLGLRGRGAVMSAWDELDESVPHLLGFGKARDGVVLSLLRVTEAQGDENCRRRASRCIARACGAVGGKAKSLSGVLVMGCEEVWQRWCKSVDELGLSGLGMYGRAGDVLRVPGRLAKPSLLGTLMARCLMRFPGGPGQAARDSMAALTNVQLMALIGEASGSRLVEQWVQDERSERAAKLAAKVMRAMYECGDRHGVLGVARNPYGAMVIVRCSSVLAAGARKQLMETLASDVEGLRGNEWGQIVIRKCRVEQYMRRTDAWEKEETAKETRQRLFADILEDVRDEEPRHSEEQQDKDKHIKPSKRHKMRKLSDGQQSGDRENEMKEVLTSDMSNRKGGQTGDSGGANADVQGDAGQSGLQTVLSAIEMAAVPAKKKDKRNKKRKRDTEAGE